MRAAADLAARAFGLPRLRTAQAAGPIGLHPIPLTLREPPYEIRRSRIQGRGVFATRRIRPGQRILEYTGEQISNDEADRRYDESRMRRHHTFLFTLDDDTVVDGGRGGNDARLINHSCDPNCVAVIDRGRIFIEAKKNIQPGVELTYDYQYERTEDADEEFYACRCGAKRCRGTIMKPERRRAARPRRTRSGSRGQSRRRSERKRRAA